jgi:hypothetical protein
VSAADALDQEPNHRRSEDGATAALDTRLWLAHVGAADALDQEPNHRRGEDGATAALDTRLWLAHVGAADALDQECDGNSSPRGTALESINGNVLPPR